MTDGLPLTSALAATMAERNVTTPIGGLRMSAVLLTLKTFGGARAGLDGLEDALRVWVRNAPARRMSANCNQGVFLLIFMLQPDWTKTRAFLRNARPF